MFGDCRLQFSTLPGYAIARFPKSNCCCVCSFSYSRATNPGKLCTSLRHHRRKWSCLWSTVISGYATGRHLLSTKTPLSINVTVANGAASNAPSSVAALPTTTSYQSIHSRQLTPPSLTVPPLTHRHKWFCYWPPPRINLDAPDHLYNNSFHHLCVCKDQEWFSPTCTVFYFLLYQP